MPHIIAVSNQKGGVGKTTTAINLAASLAHLGYSTLLVDLDPQGNASSGLGLERQDTDDGVFEVMLGYSELAEVVHPTAVEGLHLLPAGPSLVGAEVELASLRGREKKLKDAIAKVGDRYDFVILDCPPALGFLTLNALVAANGVLIPVQSEYYAMEGLGQLLRTMSEVKKGLNPQLRREGLLITLHDTRNNLCRDVESQIREVFKDEVFDAVVPRNVRLAEAPSYGQPILTYARSCKGSQAYLKLAGEVLEGLGYQVSADAVEAM